MVLVVSLTEKLQAKEDPLPVDAAHVPAMQFTMKVEDRLSMDSGESAVVDENGPQLVDGCDSYLPSEYYPGCVATPLEGIQSEDDDGSDDGRSYFSNAFVATEEQHREEGETLGWWVVSLTEKLQAKEDPLPVDAAHVPAMQFTMKVEDRLSMDSGESAVVDENGPQLVDGCDSYLPSEYYPGCVAPPLEGIQSEDDDGSDEGRSYFSDAFVATEEQHREEGETLGWWVWS
ncbi:unnamed protein product [Ilex paraguariensis]|uniref:Uncharacterized protein n=1 Tax=Ilex paraguariensis TaxID=185542 RepID=A0ABC8T0A3_9AQUA